MDRYADCYRRYIQGEEEAFDEIVKGLFDPLVFFLNRYVHDLHTAEDLAIDAFSDLLLHRSRYNYKASLKTYLFMIGRSRALNHIKHRRVLTFSPLSEAEEVAGAESVEEAVLIDERRRLVNTALAELSPDMQVAVHLIFFEELSYQEAAKVMKKNAKQVDNLLYRAKRELRAILKREEVWL